MSASLAPKQGTRLCLPSKAIVNAENRYGKNLVTVVAFFIDDHAFAIRRRALAIATRHTLIKEYFLYDRII